MAGLVFTIDGTFTDTSLPILRDDERLTEGSLFLFDPSHSLAPLSGVPASGAALENIAWKEAAALIGSGDQTTLVGLAQTNLTATDGILELSAKGGLHAMMSQSTAAASRSAGIVLPALVRQYIYDHTPQDSPYDQEFAISIWETVTRIGIAGSPIIVFYSSSTANELARVEASAIQPSVRIGSANVPAQNSLGATLRTFGFREWAGTRPGAYTSVTFDMGWGAKASGAFLAQQNKSRSSVLYSYHVVNLTAAGLTFSEFHARELALFNAAFASGGRFHGDTYSDPATVIP